MRISDWSSDVCSSDLAARAARHDAASRARPHRRRRARACTLSDTPCPRRRPSDPPPARRRARTGARGDDRARPRRIEDDRRSGEPPDGEPRRALRSEEHTSELQSLMRISYAVLCLKKKTKNQRQAYRKPPPSTKKDDTT